MGNFNVVGLIALVIFYLLILAVGILAAWLKTRKTENRDGSETVIVAGRNIGLFVGIFTMTATWVGGGYINGTAEAVFDQGLIHAQAPIGYASSLIVGGLLFARPMRSKRYVTMLDPFQQKYGNRIGGLLFLPALCGELFWSAAVLNALGSSVSVIMNFDFTVSVVISACVAVTYTFFGGLYSVAYTDVVQLICIAFGLTLCIPFAWHNDNVCWEGMSKANGTIYSVCGNSIAHNGTAFKNNWVGVIDRGSIGSYVDSLLLLVFGGIPWQVYFQRVLSVDKPWKAQALSLAGAVGCILMSIPPAIVGVIARFTDWDGIGFGWQRILAEKQLVLPLVVQFLTPTAVTFFGLGAISAAVMSSSDSSILSASSMFAHNIYKMIFRENASEKEIVWVIRGAILVCGATAMGIGVSVSSVYSLWFLCSDLVYVILFPQLLAVIYFPFVNSYGVLCGFFSGLFVRLLGGESTLGLSPVITYSKNFPFKTLCMLINLSTTLVVSAVTMALFKRNMLSKKFDFLNVYHGLGFPEQSDTEKRNNERRWKSDETMETPQPGVGNPAYCSTEF